jgi:hypothetical protein
MATEKKERKPAEPRVEVDLGANGMRLICAPGRGEGCGWELATGDESSGERTLSIGVQDALALIQAANGSKTNLSLPVGESAGADSTPLAKVRRSEKKRLHRVYSSTSEARDGTGNSRNSTVVVVSLLSLLNRFARLPNV